MGVVIGAPLPDIITSQAVNIWGKLFFSIRLFIFGIYINGNVAVGIVIGRQFWVKLNATSLYATEDRSWHTKTEKCNYQYHTRTITVRNRTHEAITNVGIEGESGAPHYDLDSSGEQLLVGATYAIHSFWCIINFFFYYKFSYWHELFQFFKALPYLPYTI